MRFLNDRIDYMLHVRMYILGDTFDIPNLRQQTALWPPILLDRPWGKPCIHTNFIIIMRFVFDSTPENDKELLPLIISETKQYLSELMRKQNCSGRFRELLRDEPALSWQLLDRCI